MVNITANNKAELAKSMLDIYWNLMVILGVCISFFMFGDAAIAATDDTVGGDSNAIEQVFCNVVLILTGTTGKAIATVAVIAVGVGALLGKISWGMSLIVALGVALIFGAASIVMALGGTGTSCSAGSILTT